MNDVSLKDLNTMQTIIYVGINNGNHAYKDAALLTLLAIVEDLIDSMEEDMDRLEEEFNV